MSPNWQPQKWQLRAGLAVEIAKMTAADYSRLPTPLIGENG
jgi:hypothetical protein